MRSKHCQTLNVGVSDTHSQFASLIPFGTCDGQLRAMVSLSCPAALPAALPSLYFSSATQEKHIICCALCYSYLSGDLLEELTILQKEKKKKRRQKSILSDPIIFKSFTDGDRMCHVNNTWEDGEGLIFEQAFALFSTMAMNPNSRFSCC